MVQGTSSDGLTTKVLPVARAYGMNQNGTMAGKLNGAIIANTPIGTRRTSASIPGAAPTRTSGQAGILLYGTGAGVTPGDATVSPPRAREASMPQAAWMSGPPE